MVCTISADIFYLNDAKVGADDQPNTGHNEVQRRQQTTCAKFAQRLAIEANHPPRDNDPPGGCK
jgi:hypothetical protein